MSAETPDLLHLSIRRSARVIEHRHWRITRPPPSLALALQANVARAFGPAYDRIATAVLRMMEGEAAREDAAAEARATGGESLALDTFRRAATGAALCDPGEPLERAAARLRACVSYAVGAAGGRMDAASVAGEFADSGAGGGSYGGGMGDGASDGGGGGDDPTPAGEVAWLRAGLVHVVLYHSRLEWGGAGPQFDEDVAARDKAAEALTSSLSQGPVAFARALDGVLASAEELRLLFAWAVLHLLRPF